jgi:DNA-binding transcriptional ArsR family regulator
VGTLRDDQAMAGRAAATVRALAHPDRVRLVAALCQGDAGVDELSRRLGLPRVGVARHLRVLAAQRLVAGRGRGAARIYCIEEPVLHGLVACMEECSR